MTGGSVKHLGRGARIASRDVSVVAIVLGKGLFKDDWPHGAVWSNPAEESLPIAFDRQPVVNYDSVRNAKSIEVNSVDASFIQLSLLVKEESLDAVWSFGKSGGGRQKPAVP